MLNERTQSLKILIITQGLSAIVEPLFNSKHTIVGVVESAARGQKKNGISSQIRTLVFWLSKFVLKNPTLKKYCSKKNTNYCLMFSSNDQGLEEFILKNDPDIIVIHSMSQLLKSNIYNIPHLGTINLHPSYLPEYRGPNPDFWQYYDCEMSPGVTIHFVNKGEDTGDIIDQERILITPGMRAPERSQKLVRELGIQLLLKSLDSLANNKVQRKPQPSNSPTVRARNIESTEHTNLINWKEWSVNRIWNLLRGTEQWLNAINPPRGIYRGQRWTVEGFEKISVDNLEPGKVYKKQGIHFVACRDGIIHLSIKFNTKQIIKNMILKALKIN